MEQLTVIQQLCDGITLLENPDNWTILTTILKHQWLPLVVSFIVIPLVVFAILSSLFGNVGKIKQSKLLIINLLIMFFSLVIGIVVFLLMNIFPIPFIN